MLAVGDWCRGTRAYDSELLAEDWATCCSRLSIPSRIDSRERDMVLSWELGSRFSEIARCRSSRESLMWSARRKSWDGLAMLGCLERARVLVSGVAGGVWGLEIRGMIAI